MSLFKKIERTKDIPRESCVLRKMRVEVYLFGEEKNIPSCISCKQGIEKKCTLTHHYETALLITLAWQVFYWLFSSLGWQWDSLVRHSSPLFLGKQSHFVQPFLPLIWNDLALLCIQGFFFFLASSKPSRKVQDHYNRQKCSEIAHHCQLITKKSFNSWHYYKLYTHYDRDNWALCFSCPALEPQTMPSCCWEWPGCTWKQVGSLHGLPMLTTAACGPLGTPCSWVGVR